MVGWVEIGVVVRSFCPINVDRSSQAGAAGRPQLEFREARVELLGKWYVLAGLLLAGHERYSFGAFSEGLSLRPDGWKSQLARRKALYWTRDMSLASMMSTSSVGVTPESISRTSSSTLRPARSPAVASFSTIARRF